ncbi:MAG: hypothetical protein D6692_08590 [Planctomycetota bacterium]|nr:MAG: hypothetical protein D6692_08590 [Planctomycetota bacterium]
MLGVLGGCHGEIGEAGEQGVAGVPGGHLDAVFGDGVEVVGRPAHLVGLDDGAELGDGDVVPVADVERVDGGVQDLAEELIGEFGGGLVGVRVGLRGGHGGSVPRRRMAAMVWSGMTTMLRTKRVDARGICAQMWM